MRIQSFKAFNAVILGLLFGICLWIGLWRSPAVEAATLPDPPTNNQTAPIVLTLDLLQERLRSPIKREGVPIVDLQGLVIDLRPENAEFRDQFYTRLQTQLQRSGSAIGLDLSHSQIQGEFDISQLGLRAPLFGQALSPLFTPAEQEQLERDRRRLLQLSQLSQALLLEDQAVIPGQDISVFRGPLKLAHTRFGGPVQARNMFFLGWVEVEDTNFVQEADWSATRFSQPVSFSRALFRRGVEFRSSIFFSKARFSLTQFQGIADFQGSEFQAPVSFRQARFQQLANFNRVLWRNDADFSQAHWQDHASFTKSQFLQSCFLTDTLFEKFVTFREAQFKRPVNLRGANLLDQMDFSDAGFAQAVYLNIPGLRLDTEQAKILGNPGQIGRVLLVPSLQGNENLLRNLVRRFRQLEQIADANQVEYMTEQLRLRELQQQLLGANLNTASAQRLVKLGFSPEQAATIVEKRSQHPFQQLNEILTLEDFDLATYFQVRDQVIAQPPLALAHYLQTAVHWLGLSLILLLSHDGTNFWLVFGVGLVAIAIFGLMFWLVDRLRRLRPRPIAPTITETVWAVGGYGVLTLWGLAAIFRTADHPWLTLLCLAIVTLPLPVTLMVLIYQQGRYHNLMDVSYFVEDASLRQLRLLIGRLPIMPRFTFFRDRYMPLLWDRRWNWLNYYDFSLNNLLRFGFNDIRLRDEALPGLISTLAWYQWSLGLLYITLLLWTLSRTIPGLNLLIYFK